MKMVANTKDRNLMDFDMEKENFSIRMVECTRANGVKTKCKVKIINYIDYWKGRGTLYYYSGKPAYVGDWVDDRFEGIGVLYNEEPAKLY